MRWRALPDLLRHAARVHAPRTALVTPADGALTYAALDARVDARAADLLSQGLVPGDRVGVSLPNGATFVEMFHAAARAGLVLVPLNTRLTAPERDAQIARAAVRVVVTEERCVDARGPVPPARAADRDTPQVIIFTSGTSGTPKAAVLTHRNLLMSAAASAARLGVVRGDAWLAPIPLFHVGGLAILVRAALAGHAVHLVPRFTPGQVNAVIDAGTVSLVSLVPTMLHQMLDARNDRPFPGTLRAVLLGGAPASVALLARASAARVPVAATYGLTECASQVATMPPSSALEKPGSVGPPLKWMRLRVDGADAEGIGELLVRGPAVMAAYDGEPARGPDEWFRTGDLGRVDADGDLWVVSRRTDLIVTGGENVYPAEVEAVFCEHASVAEACVVGLPHHVWGETVAVGLVAKADHVLDVVSVLEHARGKLAAYKMPRDACVLNEIPRTASGKVARGEVARILADQATSPT